MGHRRCEPAARQLQRADQALSEVVELPIGAVLLAEGWGEPELVAHHPTGQQVDERHEVDGLSGVQLALELSETRTKHVVRDDLQV